VKGTIGFSNVIGTMNIMLLSQEWFGSNALEPLRCGHVAKTRHVSHLQRLQCTRILEASRILLSQLVTLKKNLNVKVILFKSLIKSIL
jgi:hypothetical protein